MFEEFIKKIKGNEPFSFSRWGDGEWNSLLAIDGPDHKNTDGHSYFPEMGEALANVLKSKPSYFLGMQRFAAEDRFPNEINEFCAKNDLNYLRWINADIFHHASIKGYFEEFFDALNARDEGVILVGPKYLENLGKFHSVFIEVPEKNCWTERERIMHEVRGQLLKASKNVIVLFVASMASNYMIDEVYKSYGDKHTLLDMGSVFDAYVGKATRSYHKKVIERLK